MNDSAEIFFPTSVSEENSLHKHKESSTLINAPLAVVKEGNASVDFPTSLDVFYNPVQEFNRDFSIAVLRLYASDYKLLRDAWATKAVVNSSAKSCRKMKLKEEDFNLTAHNTNLLPVEKSEDGIRVLEALSASGLRSIRYAKEVGGIKEIVANDISKAAIDCMKVNVTHNEVENIVTPSLNDASLLMYENRSLEKRFDVIDLDPYGSPHIFLDGAVQSIADGGLLFVTCTDMAVLCGKSPESCNLKYGALSMKHKACHEMGLRIILQCIESNANKYGKYIVPLISLSADFYCRVFVRVFTSQVKCKESFSKLSWVHQCTSCESTSFQQLGHVVRNGNSVKYQLGSPPVGPTCQYCGGINETAGPIWTAPIHDVAFVSRLRKTLEGSSPLGTQRRIEGTLSLMEEELPSVPLYFVLDKLFSVLRMSTCRRKEFASALLNSKFKVSPTHCHKNGIKTNAPMEFIWKILRAKEKEHPIKTDKLPRYHPAIAILRGEKKVRAALRHTKPGDSSDLKFNCNPLQNIPPETAMADFTNSANTNAISDVKIDFSIHPDAESESEKRGFLRFQVNPEKNWGPKMRATTSLYNGDLQNKSRTNQGKRKRKQVL